MVQCGVSSRRAPAEAALSRRPDEARRVLPDATRIVAADVRDEASLRGGLTGHDRGEIGGSGVEAADRHRPWAEPELDVVARRRAPERYRYRSE